MISALGSKLARMADISGWQDFFLDISKLSDSTERQYGIAQLNYTEYILEWLALCIDTCSNIQEIIDTSKQATELQECSHTVAELTEHLQRLHYRWGEYKMNIKQRLIVVNARERQGSGG